ncbi:hypothetical protein BCR42DRAFT_402913 [Absidia repens]|uniref:Uncharacterized protein n=1 Tax=Absidia repens TaxID=90262 RepID=A0A1X2IYL3_9FUNG|nr:hypothetical protein BCR42DRAFT_402913 [Absidia repens]
MLTPVPLSSTSVVNVVLLTTVISGAKNVQRSAAGKVLVANNWNLAVTWNPASVASPFKTLLFFYHSILLKHIPLFELPIHSQQYIRLFSFLLLKQH